MPQPHHLSCHRAVVHRDGDADATAGRQRDHLVRETSARKRGLTGAEHYQPCAELHREQVGELHPTVVGEEEAAAQGVVRVGSSVRGEVYDIGGRQSTKDRVPRGRLPGEPGHGEEGLEDVELREFECLGACDMAPMASVDGRFVGPLTEADAAELVSAMKERREVLLRFNAGSYPIVATSRVLNEGVNVPEANVAVILSGSGSVREHVQRLGRILRKSGDKEATLYEVITRGTVEE